MNLVVEPDVSKNICIYRHNVNLPQLDPEDVRRKLEALALETKNKALIIQGYDDGFRAFMHQKEREARHKQLEDETGLHLYQTPEQLKEITKHRQMFHMQPKSEDEVDRKMEKLIRDTFNAIKELQKREFTGDPQSWTLNLSGKVVSHKDLFHNGIEDSIRGVLRAAERESLAINGEVEAFDMEEHTNFWKNFLSQVSDSNEKPPSLKKRKLEDWFHS